MLGVIEELSTAGAATPADEPPEETAERPEDMPPELTPRERKRKDIALTDAERLYQLADGHTDAKEERMFTLIVRKHLDGDNIDNLYEMYSQVLGDNDALDRGDLVQDLFFEDLDALGYEVLRRMNALPGGKEKLSKAQDSAGKIPAKVAAALKPMMAALQEDQKHWPDGAPKWNNYVLED
jgi:hypothetical protein